MEKKRTVETRFKATPDVQQPGLDRSKSVGGTISETNGIPMADISAGLPVNAIEVLVLIWSMQQTEVS